MPVGQTLSLWAVGTALREDFALELPQLRPIFERSLRRLLERDVAERSRPQQTWCGAKQPQR
jgi:hypothetical protein